MQKEINPILFVGNPQWYSYYYKKYMKEKYDDPNSLPQEMSTGVFTIFLILLVLSIIIWISTVVRLIMKGKEMPTWAIIIAILLLIFPVPGGVFLSFALTFTKKY